MSTLSIVRKGLSVINPPQLIGADLMSRSGEFWMLNQNGLDYKFSYTGHNSSLKAYEKCAPFNAIINKKAKAYSNGRTWILNKSGKAKGKEATGELATKLRMLLANPNPLQTWKEFEAQQYIYQQVFGYSLLLIIKPAGFPNTSATRLWNIPPVMLDIEETKKLFVSEGNVIKKIVLVYENERTELPLDLVHFFKDFTPSFNSFVIPESRVCALEMPINNIIGAYESRNVLINYRGALGIISPDSKDSAGYIPLKPEDKEALQEEFLRYGLKNNQWKFILSSASVKWSQMGISTRELMLFEEVEDDIMRICDSYDFPYPLLSNLRTNSLGGNNIGEAKILLYQDAIIPEAETNYEKWNSVFELDKYGLVLDKDFGHVQALQGDAQKNALARKTRNEAYQVEFYNNLCTLNEWRIANNDDPIDRKGPAGEDYGNMYYYELMAAGWQFGKTGFTLNDLRGDQGNQNNNQQNN